MTVDFQLYILTCLYMNAASLCLKFAVVGINPAISSFLDQFRFRCL